MKKWFLPTIGLLVLFLSGCYPFMAHAQQDCGTTQLVSTQQVPASTEGAIAVRFNLTKRCAGTVSTVARGLPDGFEISRTDSDERGWYVSIRGGAKAGQYKVRFNVYQGALLTGALEFKLVVISP